MKKSMIILVLCFFCILLFTQDFSFSTNLQTGFLLEKGTSSSKILLFSGVELSVLFPWYGGCFDVGINYHTGSFMGSMQSFGLKWLNRFSISPFYNPSAGISLELDSGDYLFFSIGNTDMPFIPLFYAGISVEPLAFIVSPWRISLFKLSLLTGVTASLPLRLKTDLLSIALEPGKEKVRAVPVIGLSTGVSGSLIGNFQSSGWNFPEIGLSFYYQLLEASLIFKGFNTFYPEEYKRGFHLGTELLFSPVNNFWSPAVGAGYYYFSLDPQDRYYDADSHGIYGVLKALRFNFPINQVFYFSVSAMELRFAPLYAYELKNKYDQGNFLLQLALFRISLNYAFSERKNK